MSEASREALRSVPGKRLEYGRSWAIFCTLAIVAGIGGGLLSRQTPPLDHIAQVFPRLKSVPAPLRGYVFISPEDCTSRWGALTLLERDTTNLRLERILLLGSDRQLSQAINELRAGDITQPVSVASAASRRVLQTLGGDEASGPFLLIVDAEGFVRLATKLPASTEQFMTLADLLAALVKQSEQENPKKSS